MVVMPLRLLNIRILYDDLRLMTCPSLKHKLEGSQPANGCFVLLVTGATTLKGSLFALSKNEIPVQTHPCPAHFV